MAGSAWIFTKDGVFLGAGEGGGAGTKWIFVHKIYDIYLQNE